MARTIHGNERLTLTSDSHAGGEVFLKPCRRHTAIARKDQLRPHREVVPPSLIGRRLPMVAQIHELHIAGVVDIREDIRRLRVQLAKTANFGVRSQRLGGHVRTHDRPRFAVAAATAKRSVVESAALEHHGRLDVHVAKLQMGSRSTRAGGLAGGGLLFEARARARLERAKRGSTDTSTSPALASLL
jgi:hypothetical protein